MFWGCFTLESLVQSLLTSSREKKGVRRGRVSRKHSDKPMTPGAVVGTGSLSRVSLERPETEVPKCSNPVTEEGGKSFINNPHVTAGPLQDSGARTMSLSLG